MIEFIISLCIWVLICIPIILFIRGKSPHENTSMQRRKERKV